MDLDLHLGASVEERIGRQWGSQLIDYEEKEGEKRSGSRKHKLWRDPIVDAENRSRWIARGKGL